MNYTAANAFCQRFGWALTTVEGAAEFAYLKTTIAGHTDGNGMYCIFYKIWGY